MVNLLRRRRSQTPEKRDVEQSDESISPRTLRRELDRLFEDFFSPTWVGGQATTEFSPAIELMETDNDFVLRAELPGMTEKNIHVEVDDDNVLTICGEKQRENKGKGRGYQYTEVSYGQFTRSVQLPASVDASKIAAAFEDGVLDLHIPKTVEARAHTIPITKSSKGKIEVSASSAAPEAGNGSRSPEPQQDEQHAPHR